jgi:hypothetical protein
MRQLPGTPSNTGPDALAIPKFPTGGALYSQYDNPATKPPLGIGSQKFEPAMAAFDDQAADDFVITAPPPPMFLYITGVRVMGEYSEGGGPASSFNVYLYTNGAGNLPGTQFAAFLNRPYTGTPPDFTINLGNPFSLPSGTYWVSVQARQDFNPNGQWFWHNRTVQSNAGAAWQNPGNGYGTGCITWNRKNACMPAQVWPDQVFEILGFAEGPTPTATATAPRSPTPTATATGTFTPPPTPTFTPTPTPSATATATGTITATVTATPTGCSATSSACGSIVVGTPPTEFTVDLNAAADPAGIQGSDFTVNGTPANAAILINGNLTIRFRFNTSPVVQGLNTMHIPACAFDCGNGCVQELTCTFTYQAATPTPTATPTQPPPTATPTATTTPRATPSPRVVPTPRPRVTPAPRP